MSATPGAAGAPWRRALAAGVCLLVAAASYLGATGQLGSLYDFRSPLAGVPVAAPLEPTGPLPPLSRRVVAVLVDGLRVDTSVDATTMPFLASLRERGASTEMSLRTPSYSVPGWTVLMTGAWIDLHGGLAMNPPNVAQAPTWTADSIFAAAHDAGKRTAVVGTDWFVPLIPPAQLSTSFFVHDETDAADQASTDAATTMLTGDQVDFLLVHLNEVDHASHYAGGGTSPAARTAAAKADARLQAIAGAMDLSRDTLVVFSDHGHLDQGGHGGPEDVVVHAPFVMAGAGVKPNEPLPGGEQIEVAPTLAVLLGTRIPATAQGLAMSHLLVLDDASVATLRAAQARQQQQLLARYASAIGRPVPSDAPTIDAAAPSAARSVSALQNARLAAERGARLPWVIAIGVGLLGALALWWRRNPRRAGWAVAGAAAYLLVFHGYYWGVARRTYSLSSVSSATDIILATASATALGLHAAWLVALVGERPGRRGAAGTLGGVGYAVGLTLAVPVLVGFLAGGWTVTWILPEARVMFLQFFAQVQGLVVAVLTLLGGLVAVAIGRTRRNRAPAH